MIQLLLVAGAAWAAEGAPELQFLVQPMFVLTDEGPGYDSQVLLRRAKISVSGVYSGSIGYWLQADPSRWTRGTREIGAALDDAWFDLRFHDAFQLRIGQFKTPYSAQWLTSGHSLLLPERAVPTDAFAYGRDVGLMAHGEAADLLEWQLALVEGGGPNRWNVDTPGYLVMARIALTPLGPFPLDELDTDGAPKLGIGLSANRRVGDRQNSGDLVLDLRDHRVGAELRFAANGLTATGEVYALRLRTWTAPEADQPAIGGYAQAGYLVPGTVVVPSARLSYLDRNTDLARNAERSAELGLTIFVPDRRTDATGDHLDEHARLTASGRFDKPTARNVATTLSLQLQVAW